MSIIQSQIDRTVKADRVSYEMTVWLNEDRTSRSIQFSFPKGIFTVYPQEHVVQFQRDEWDDLADSTVDTLNACLARGILTGRITFNHNYQRI